MAKETNIFGILITSCELFSENSHGDCTEITSTNFDEFSKFGANLKIFC